MGVCSDQKEDIESLGTGVIGSCCSLPSPSLKPACQGSTVCSGMELPSQSFCRAHSWSLLLCCIGAIHMVTLPLDPKIIWQELGPLPLPHNCVQNSKIEL